MSGRVLTLCLAAGAGVMVLAVGLLPDLRWRSAAAPLDRLPAREPMAERPSEPEVAAEADSAGQAGSGSSAAAPGSPFASEDDYLRELSRLRLTDRHRALELVRSGAHWYSSHGERAAARQAMGITLLVDVGEMEEAREAARRFIATHPTSAYRPLVQGVTGIHPRPTGPGPELRR